MQQLYKQRTLAREQLPHHLFQPLLPPHLMRHLDQSLSPVGVTHICQGTANLQGMMLYNVLLVHIHTQAQISKSFPLRHASDVTLSMEPQAIKAACLVH